MGIVEQHINAGGEGILFQRILLVMFCPLLVGPSIDGIMLTLFHPFQERINPDRPLLKE